MLIELTINNLIHSMECLISDDLDELISWSGNLTSKHLDKNIKNKSKDIDFIKGLEGFRKKIEDKRLNKSKSDLDNIINNFLKKIKEIQKYYFDNTKYKKNKGVKKENVFLFLIANSKPYLDGDYDLKTDKFEYSGPKDYFYNMLPFEDYEKYSFYTEEVKNNVSNYIKGFAITIAYLFENKVDNKLLKSFKDASTWGEIHHLGCRIRDYVIAELDFEFGKDIYDVDYSISHKNYIEKITSERDLKVLLRNRDIMLQNIDYINESSVKHGYDETFPIFFQLVLFSLMRNEKTEIIEFKYNTSKVDYVHSYLIYIYQGTSLSNGSYWFLFKDTALSAKDGYRSNGKMRMDILLEQHKDKFNYLEYSIEPKIFHNYLSKHCRNYVKKVMLENSLKDSNSMLNELIHLYINIKTIKDKIIHIDWGHEFDKGEIDSLIVTENEIYIIQSKTNYTDIKTVKKHFNDVIKYLPKYCKERKLGMNDKTIIKELFFFERPYLDDEELAKLNECEITVLFLDDIVEKNKNILNEKQYDKIYRIMSKNG
jgi:hypothetical protein